MTVPTSISSEIQKLAPSAIIEMFEIDATVIGGSVYRFHSGKNGLIGDIVWQGNTYSAFPIEASGFEWSGKGQLPRPVVRVSNVLGTMTALVLQYDDLAGVKVTRIRTLQKYLDDANFPIVQKPGGNVLFTRTNPVSTRVNTSGYIETVGANTPRFDYDPVTLAPKGLLVEEQRENLLLYSDQFNNTSGWAVSNGTISADIATSPDGTSNADKLIANSGIGLTSVSVLSAVVSKPAAATTYTYSVYGKAAGLNRLRLFIHQSGNTANRATAIISLIDGSVTSIGPAGTFTAATATVTNVGNGWYRCCLTFTSSTETALIARVYPSDSTITTGDGTSGILLSGAQLEVGAFATSYIPTTATKVTRTADNAIATALPFASWYATGGGTLIAEVIPQLTNGANRFIATMSDGTTSNRAAMFKASGGNAGFRAASGGTAGNPTAPATQLTGNVTHKIAITFAPGTNNVNGAVDGVLGTASTLAAMPVGLNSIRFGTNEAANADYFNGHICRFLYYDRKFTDVEMQSVTSGGSVSDLPAMEVNFVNGSMQFLIPGNYNPNADPTAEFPRDIYYIDRKSGENRDAIEFELSASLDLAGVALPRRQIVQNYCPWRYRGAECGYTGTNYYDTNDNPVGSLAQDVCGKRLSSCRARFGQYNALPYGGFPAAGLLKL